MSCPPMPLTNAAAGAGRCVAWPMTVLPSGSDSDMTDAAMRTVGRTLAASITPMVSVTTVRLKATTSDGRSAVRSDATWSQRMSVAVC